MANYVLAPLTIYYYYYWKRPALVLGKGITFTWRNLLKRLYTECDVNQSINQEI